MARPSTRNPLDCFLRRQIDDRMNHCKRLVSARIDESDNLFRKDLLSHYGCVNAIEFSPQGDLLVSGGDDRRVLLWKVEQAIQGVGKPMAMRAQHGSNIFCLGYDSGKTKIFSAGNDDQVIVHNLRTGDPLNFFLHEKAVYGLSIHPHNDNVFSSACDDGRVLIFDIRDSSSTETFCMAQYKTAFHSVMFNPVEPRTLATANATEGISLWDVRKPLTPVLCYGSEGPPQGCMNVRFNSAGTRLLALRRRLPPVLYAVDSPIHLCHFDQPGYYNSCTMKSCCFAGDDDEYVLSGSDDFNLYMWKIPSEDVKWVNSAHMILRGHRSIVNQVRYNKASCILASSGVEKIIKIWSPFPLCNFCLGGLRRDSGKQERQRRVFTHDEYIGLVLRSGQFMTHDYSHQSTREDPRMMAFFDSLVQREIEGWGSEDTPAAQRNLSESKNTSTTGQTQSATDSDDSTTSAHQLMRSVLGTTARNSSRTGAGAGVAPERSIDSPNRITRLIGNRRGKLMSLAAVEAGAQVVNPLSGSANADEVSDSEERKVASEDNEDDEVSSKSKSKSKSRAKGLKRKQGAVSGRRSRARRKCVVYNLKIPSDSDSEVEPAPAPKKSSDSEGDLFLVDATQPSTSSGLSSRRSRYAVTSIPIDSEPGGSSKSSCNSEAEDASSTKRKRLRTDAEGTSRSYRRRHCKSKNHTDGAEPRRSSANPETKRATSWGEYTNGATRERGQREVRATPSKRLSNSGSSKALPPTPDSGITSDLSTVEKFEENASRPRNGLESSDCESKLKNLECFKKKVDVARRGYRKRSTPQAKLTVSTATDSSD